MCKNHGFLSFICCNNHRSFDIFTLFSCSLYWTCNKLLSCCYSAAIWSHLFVQKLFSQVFLLKINEKWASLFTPLSVGVSIDKQSCVKELFLSYKEHTNLLLSIIGAGRQSQVFCYFVFNFNDLVVTRFSSSVSTYWTFSIFLMRCK